MTPTGSDASMTFAVDIPPELVAGAVAALAEAGVDLRPEPDLINYAPGCSRPPPPRRRPAPPGPLNQRASYRAAPDAAHSFLQRSVEPGTAQPNAPTRGQRVHLGPLPDRHRPLGTSSAALGRRGRRLPAGLRPAPRLPARTCAWNCPPGSSTPTRTTRLRTWPAAATAWSIPGRPPPAVTGWSRACTAATPWALPSCPPACPGR